MKSSLEARVGKAHSPISAAVWNTAAELELVREGFCAMVRSVSIQNRVETVLPRLTSSAAKAWSGPLGLDYLWIDL